MKLWITGVAGHDTLRMNHNACCQISVWNTFQSAEVTYIYQRKGRLTRKEGGTCADGFCCGC